MITLVIKSPSRPTGQLRLESVPLEITVGQLKEILSKQYPGNPQPSDQTLIYAGKVLKDASVTLKQLIGSTEHSDGSPYHVHLVVKPTLTDSSASTSQSQPQASTSQAVNTQPTSGTTSQAEPTVTPAQTNDQESLPAQSGVANALQQVLEALGAGSTDWQAGDSLPYPVLPTLPPIQHPSITYTVHPVVASAYNAAYNAALAAGHQAHKQLLLQNSVQPVSANVQPAAATTSAEQLQGHAGVSDASGSSYNAAGARQVPPDQLQQLIAQLQESANAINSALSQANADSSEAQRQQQLEQLKRLSAQVQQQVSAVQAQAALQTAQSTLASVMHVERVLAQEQQRQQAFVAARQAAEVADMIAAQAQNFGARRRAGGRGGGAAAGGPAAAGAAAPRRQRTFILRINMRALLQLLVFAMVLYQHFTWKRFAMLATLAFALWLTSLAPLRRFIASLQAPHLPRPAAPQPIPAAQPAPGNEQQPQGQQPVNADANVNLQGNAAGEPGGQQDQHATLDRQGQAQRQQPVRRGILGEIAVVLVGFVTSLLPSWNYNPDDAAAFAVAQDVEAREQQQARRQAQQAGAGEQQQAAQPPVGPANDGNHPHQD